MKHAGTLKEFLSYSNYPRKKKSKPPPVSVVDVLSKRRDAERVLNSLHNLSAVSTGRMHALHFMCACRREITLVADQAADIVSQMIHPSEMHRTCIGPAQLRALRVISQAVGQTKVVFNQDPSVGAIHVRGLDFGGLAVPVSPV